MAVLPLADAVYRFQTNEYRLDTVVNGGATATMTTSEAVVVPSLQKFFADATATIDAKADAAVFCQLVSDYTLTSTTSSQKLFNASTNGAVTLATGRYQFDMVLFLSGMSTATADNGQFNLKGAGTATLTEILYHVTGIDITNPGNVTGALTGGVANSAASVSPIVTATTGSGLALRLSGVFNVTAAGTLIPSFALATAAAALVKAGSFISIRRLGDTGSGNNIRGNWS